MSGSDRDTESSYANLVREITGLPLIGMTLAGRDGAWSARHWDTGTGATVAETESENVRVVGDHPTVSWNHTLVPPSAPQGSQRRSVTCWGPEVHADLTRRSVLVVGLGSVGLDVALRLAATGVARLGRRSPGAHRRAPASKPRSRPGPPVLVLDVTEAEADSLLATLDPLASLAGAEPGALRDLLSRVETSSEEVRRLFAELLAGAGQVRTEYEGRHERTYGPDEGRSGCR